MEKLLFIALSLFTLNASAQKVENISVKRGDVSTFIAKEMYRFPDFKKAKVVFDNNDSGAGKMNYNYFLQNMQFIGAKKDTLTLANESKIKFVSIGDDSFFYDNGFYEWAASGSKTKLAIKRSLKELNGTQLIGAFGIPTQAAGVKSQDAVRGLGSTVGLDINEILQFVKETQYYISLNQKHFIVFNKKNLMSLFPKKEKEIDGFIKEHKINFDKEQDVVDLFVFVSQP